jgi:hypothetical protein
MIDVLQRHKRLTSLEEDFRKMGIPLPFETPEGRKILGESLTRKIERAFRRPRLLVERRMVGRKSLKEDSPVRSPYFYEILGESLKKELKRL